MHNKTEGFKKSERLKEGPVFSRLFKEGAYFKSGNFSLRFIYNKLNILRLGISLQKKAFPKATQRNSAKRLIREAFRRNKGHLSKGVDIVIKPKGLNMLTLKYTEIEKELLGLFKEAKILAKE